jgi:hypothetical protein
VLLSDDFTIVEVGKPYSMFNIGKAKNVDAAVSFEALPEKTGYTLNIYLSDMLPEEASLISSAPISVRVMKETKSFMLPLIRFGNSPLLFELIFDPTIYEDDRSMQLTLDNNLVQIVGIDSRTNIVKALHMASMPKKLREMFVSSWSHALQEENFSSRYKNWTQDIARRYPLTELWERSVYVGKFGDR